MYRIAIGDDEPKALEELRGMVSRCLEAEGLRAGEDYRRRYQDARLYLKAGSKHLSLAYQDIYAVESALHRVFLHLKDGSEEWSGSLTELAPKLPAWRFCRCHNSFVINLSHVTELVRYEARLDNGAVIPVSKRFYKSAVEQYITFLKN